MRGEQPWRTNRSRVLRSRPISAEKKLWSRLRNRQLGGHKFVRQMPIEPCFIDFVCRERKVIVEGDGSLDGTAAFVSRGIGTVYVPIRLDCPPEVAVLTLKPAEPA